jgi:hypothetical protein
MWLLKPPIWPLRSHICPCTLSFDVVSSAAEIRSENTLGVGVGCRCFGKLIRIDHGHATLVAGLSAHTTQLACWFTHPHRSSSPARGP